MANERPPLQVPSVPVSVPVPQRAVRRDPRLASDESELASSDEDEPEGLVLINRLQKNEAGVFGNETESEFKGSNELLTMNSDHLD
ncbi:hypothetical protein H4R33_006763 [Dimargaris cristalligena]|nr:hypothetical protein H4R33_006763 [Dimargaris cristalligena]